LKLDLFEKSRVVFSIFTTRVRKHLGNSTSFLPLSTGLLEQKMTKKDLKKNPGWFETFIFRV